MVDLTSRENGGFSKTFPRCISTKYLPSLNTTSKWPAANCDSNKLFHKGAFDWLYSRIKLYPDISDKFLWTRNFGPFQCYIHLNCLFLPKFLILQCIWSQTRFFQSLFHLFWFRNTFNRTSHWLRAFIPLIPVPPERESRFRLWNTWLCLRGPSGIETSLSRTKNSLQINYVISCHRMTKLSPAKHLNHLDPWLDACFS